MPDKVKLENPKNVDYKGLSKAPINRPRPIGMPEQKPEPVIGKPDPIGTNLGQAGKQPGQVAAPSDNLPMGDPKVYDSVGSAGSGFVNLSHLLSLNKGSGAKSGYDLATRTKNAGYDAQGSINDAEGRFKSAVDAFMPDDQHSFDPAASDAQGVVDRAKNSHYTGPGDLTAMDGYADLAKKVGAANDMAKNVSGGGYGVAAQVGKETGLSPTQSAASSFYMGINNPNLKSTAKFANLQGALDQANQRAMNVSNLGRQRVDAWRNAAPGMQSTLDDYNKEAAQFETQTKADTAQAKDLADQQARQDSINDNHRSAGEAEIQANSDMTWNIQHGMPAEIAYLGISWDEYQAAGAPSWETWQKTHPETSWNRNKFKSDHLKG